MSKTPKTDAKDERDALKAEVQFNETWLGAVAQELMCDERPTGWQMKLAGMVRDLQRELTTAQAEIERLAEKYNELIMAVARKWPDETRHQTALRYIMQAEAPSRDTGATKAAAPKERGVWLDSIE